MTKNIFKVKSGILQHSRNNLQLNCIIFQQIEQMEFEELMTQKKLRTEVIQLEDMLALVRKEYETLWASTTLRTVLGTKNLAEILSDREAIATHLLEILDATTDPLGDKVK